MAVLVRSAEERFHVPFSSLQAHSDMISVLLKLFDHGEVSVHVWYMLGALWV